MTQGAKSTKAEAKKETGTEKDTAPHMFGFDMPQFDPARFDMSKMEVHTVMREAAEKTLAQAKDAYARLKTAAEDTTSMIESSYANATKGATEFNLKALDNARSNINAAFDFARNLLGVKTLSEAVELQTSYLRAQFETFQAQGKDLQAFAQKMTTETTAPIKESVEKAVGRVK